MLQMKNKTVRFYVNTLCPANDSRLRSRIKTHRPTVDIER